MFVLDKINLKGGLRVVESTYLNQIPTEFNTKKSQFKFIA